MFQCYSKDMINYYAESDNADRVHAMLGLRWWAWRFQPGAGRGGNKKDIDVGASTGATVVKAIKAITVVKNSHMHGQHDSLVLIIPLTLVGETLPSVGEPFPLVGEPIP